jgi:hypothetical protein
LGSLGGPKQAYVLLAQYGETKISQLSWLPTYLKSEMKTNQPGPNVQGIFWPKQP